MTSPIFPGQQPWSREAAATLLDMSGKLPGFAAIGARQLDAAVALHRMLITQGSAYLADEVGMGKTYVALAVVALFRHLQPGFRVLYLAPSQNVLQKWHGRELPAFIRNNVRAPDMRIQGPAGLSPAASTACLRADDWLQAAVTDPSALDVFLPLSALSFPLTGDDANWYARVKDMAARAGVSVDLRGVREKSTYKDKAAGVINRAIPRYDLVIIDEAHLLKGGAGKSASDRARFLARALGAAGYGGGERRFGAALLLSGTPFDRDLMQLARQFELFAMPDLQIAPHQHIAALAARRNAGGSWSEIQAGLKPYMIRRVQKLDVGDTSLSRNQYRTELRAGAGISLARDTGPEALRQRLFTAVVQKRLIEHLDGENEGRFPMAMFSSWEAYAPPAATGRAAPARKDLETDEDGGTQATAGNDALDVGKEANAPQDARAVDGNLMETLVAGYRDVFGEAPPHPKLEAESRRLGQEAFGEGHKQLVFVRRLKSVDDLYVRLNEAYNTWLGNYLQAEGMPGCPGPLLAACRKAAGDTARDADQPPAPAAAAALTALGLGEGEGDPPAHMDTLFSWFFSGTLDRAGQAFADRHGLPPPDLLRARLRDPERLESIIGELDWRSFAADHSPALPDIPLPELAERASRLPGSAGVLGRYRRLQLAWAQCQAEVLAPLAARPFRLLEAHLKELLIGPNPLHERIDASAAASLLSLPTVGLALYRRQPGAEPDAEPGAALLPAWRSLWQALMGMSNDADERELSARLRALDLQREVLFALLRLDHPFIDLYLGWLGAPRDDARASARALVDRLVAVCGRRGADTGFGTGSILRNLADAWEQIAKTNFAEFLKGSNRIERARWRLEIQRHFARLPVEWASGQNTDSRAAIARRFRMPGYPMVLVATSVLQEGEDLHVCCDRVTHFGISGSPIGIEQKNGRVDRIGSRAQRRLLDKHPVADAGIRVRFPHLSESLEWYQIRDLSQSINDYLHSMHEVGASQALDDVSLATTMANRNPIPPLLTQHLSSPFEPEVGECADGVTPAGVEARLDEARHIIDHANALLTEVAREAGFTPDPGRPDCFRHEGSNAQLSLQPAHMTGELTILASRPLDAHEQPAWLGRLGDGPPGPDALLALGADPCRKHALHSVDGGPSLRVHAACFARGEAELDRSEIEDLLGRIGIALPSLSAPARPEPDTLTRVIQALLDADGSDEFQWKPGKKPTRHQIRSRGRRITLELRERWIVATRLIEAHPDPATANLLRRTLLRNASPSGPDFFYTARGEIKARMVHPLADLGAPELACILRELVAVPVQDPP